MWSRRCTYIAVLLGSLTTGALIYASLARFSEPTPAPDSSNRLEEPAVFPNSTSSAPEAPQVLTAVDELFQRQSATFDEAVARYTLRNARPPPPGYDQWFRFAKAGKCLIDDYGQLYDDLEPFHQLVELDPKYFKRMVERGIKIARGELLGMRTFKMRNHQFDITDTWPEDPGYVADWMVTIRNLSSWLPDMDLPISMRDECRVQVNVHDGRSARDMLKAKDPMPFTNRPHPTFTYYTEEGHCLYPNAESGFVDYANNVTACWCFAFPPDDAQGKIHPCFSDILFPSTVRLFFFPYYYDRSPSSPKTSYPDNVAWADKDPIIYWRGRVAGGMIHGENYRAFPRFRLIDLARAHPGTMDVALTGWNTWCDGECDFGAIEREYAFNATWAAREEIYRYKYAMDIDGHGWSGRFLGLLRSGALVFKSTIFTEYHSQWIRPFEHFIPVRPDLGDLMERLEWARTHDEEAQRIQRAGKEFADRVITDAQNDCYFSLLLLEWARLQNAKSKSWWRAA
ncbi:glycosyl transferase family 90-domain-containing protein [Mycena polygramma]|nr:glycosyl transferase family 90-domain-containing protein [Mycena polygramma]